MSNNGVVRYGALVVAGGGRQYVACLCRVSEEWSLRVEAMSCSLVPFKGEDPSCLAVDHGWTMNA